LRLEAGRERARLLLGDRARSHVPEAPHSPHDAAVKRLGLGIALEDAAVLEADDVEALVPRACVELFDAGAERRRVGDLVEHVLEDFQVVAQLEERGRNAPEPQELLIGEGDPGRPVHHQDAVGGGLEHRVAQRARHGEAVAEPTLTQIRERHERRDEAARDEVAPGRG